jgi:drug/metabolite transporter (DMT)-like permease
MKGKAGLYALIALMVAGWSGNYVAGKVALQAFPALLLYGLRVSMAAVLILPVYWWKRRRGPASWTAKDLPLLVVLGIFGVALNQFLFVMGLSRTSVAHSAIFANLTPILVLLLAGARGLEKITAGKLVGVLVALGGVVMLRALDPNPHAGGATLLGDVLTFAGSFAFAVFTVLGKPATKQHGTVTVNTIAYIGGALAMAPVTLWQSAGFDYSRVPASAWGGLIFMAAVPSVTCYLIYYHALAHMEASQLSAFSYLLPVLATLMGIAILGEHVTASLVISGAVIFTGIYLTERAR